MSEDRSPDDRTGSDDLGRRLAQDVVEVGRHEFVRLREDLVGQLRPATTGVVLLAAAGATAVLAATAASTAALRLLELVLPRRLAALALTGGYAAGSVVLLRLGLEQLRAAGGGSQRLADEVSQGLAAARRSAEGAAQARLEESRRDIRTASDRPSG
jgi:Putative Actinobacterial Holin-X, holin superfamily III